MPGFIMTHVGAFVDIERDLAQRLVAIGRVHLVGRLVALQRLRGAERVAKRPVEGGCVFRRIGHDLHVARSLRVERAADGADAAIHHVGGRDDVASGLRLDQRLAHQHGDRLVVHDLRRPATSRHGRGSVYGSSATSVDHADFGNAYS